VEESIERLEAVTLDQVRKLYTEQLGGQAGELVVVGDFDAVAATKAMDDALKGWKAGVAYRRIERPAGAVVKGERITIRTPDKANAVYNAGLKITLKDSDPDYPALALADFLFGGGSLSSRLGNRVRQKEGMSYGVGSRLNAGDFDRAGTFSMNAIYNPQSAAKLAQVIQEELDKMLKDGVTEEEMASARTAYLAQLKVRRASDLALAGLLQNGLHVGRTMDYYADLEKKVKALTAADVSAAFRKHVDPKNLIIVQAGDFKK
jgi:zinc protease